jgi:DNA polymerase-3 subunit alpha
MEIRVMQRMTDDGEAQGLRIIGENVYDLAGVRNRWARGLRIACNGNASADRLEEILGPFRPGKLPVTIRYANERVGGEIELPESWRVTPDDALIERLREWVAPENVQVLY